MSVSMVIRILGGAHLVCLEKSFGLLPFCEKLHSEGGDRF